MCTTEANLQPHLLDELKLCNPTFDTDSFLWWRPRTNGSEAWSVAFSSNHSHFAWSCGHRSIAIMPWNTGETLCRHSLSTRKTLIIDAGDYVWSLAFGQPPDAKSSAVYDHSLPRACATKFHDFRSLQILAAGLQNGHIQIFDVKTGKLLVSLLDHKDVVRDLRFSLNSPFLLSASYDGTLKLWDMEEEGNLARTMLPTQTRSGSLICCCWSPNSKWVAGGGTFTKMLFVWRTSDWVVARRLLGHSHYVSSVDFSPDGAILASASYDTTVILWDYLNGCKLTTLRHLLPRPRPIYANGANEHYIRGVCFSPAGHVVATICDDSKVRFWDVSASNALSDESPSASINDPGSMICCRYSPCGVCFAVGTRDGVIRLYSVPFSVASLQHMCRVVVRCSLDKCADVNAAVERLPLPRRLKELVMYEDFRTGGGDDDDSEGA